MNQHYITAMYAASLLNRMVGEKPSYKGGLSYQNTRAVRRRSTLLKHPTAFTVTIGTRNFTDSSPKSEPRRRNMPRTAPPSQRADDVSQHTHMLRKGEPHNRGSHLKPPTLLAHTVYKQALRSSLVPGLGWHCRRADPQNSRETRKPWSGASRSATPDRG